MFDNILPVKGQNIPFYHISLFKPLCIQIGLNSLGHSAHNNILAEQGHGLAMKRLSHRQVFIETHLYYSKKRIFSHCPKKLLEVQREHFDVPFFGGYDNFFNIFTD